MSRLRERLERLDGRREPAPAEPSESSDRAAALRRRLDRVLGAGRVVPASELPSSPAPRRPTTVDRHVTGRRHAAASGTVFVAEGFAPAHARHGTVAVEALEHLHRHAARDLFPEHLDRIAAPEEIAYLDTETTGLAGGAGTFAFLVGVGRWTTDGGDAGNEAGFRVRQLFLEDVDREEALLEHLATELEGVRCLVTYNGRSYDLPLLENRHVLNRRPWPLADVAHLDLLHPARTLWRTGHTDCRLATLERSVLGFARRGDIPGAEIPALYNRYLRHGADARMAAVFRHNRDDLLSLAGLLWAAGEAARDGRGAPAVGAGLLHARRGRHREARAALEACVEAPIPRDLRWQALRHLSLALKRDAEWNRALDVWAEMRALRPGDPFPVEESAKALEHRLGEPAAALALVEEALRSAPWSPRDRRALERRRARLEDRCARPGRGDETLG